MTEWQIVVCVMTLLCSFLMQIILVPIYVHLYNKEKKYKIMKMLCSALFIVAGTVSSYALQEKITTVSAIALSGLVCAWLGDLLFEKDKPGKTDTGGEIAYIAMNVAYVIAFSLQNYNKPTKKYGFEWFEIPVLAAVFGLFLLIIKLTKTPLPKKAVAFIYMAVFAVLFARGLSLAVYNLKMYPQMSIVVCIGIVFLFISSVCVMLNRYANKNGKGLNRLGIAAYYIAQNAFAMFVGIVHLGWNGQVSLF